MVVKQRTGWGYETLVREVSDSLHLRRFCLIALTQPDESTVRKLTRRLGPEVVDEITRAVIAKAQRETRFRGRAVRIDSTVVEADVRYPSDAVLALQGARALAREGRRLAGRLGAGSVRVVDRSRSIGKTVRAISRTLARRVGLRTEEVIELNAKAGRAMARSVREARRLAAQARAGARGRGAQSKLQAARKFGTGYSSLARLQKLPVDELKIDRTFVGNLADDGGDAFIVSSAIDLGRHLGLNVVAEGVETSQWARLAELGCHTAQGYYISRPLPAPELLDWLEAWQRSSGSPAATLSGA